MMNFLKELLAPKAFNKSSHVLVLIWYVMGVIFLGIFGEIGNNESTLDFHCGGVTSENIDLVRKKCFEKYDKQYNKYGLPIYGFMLINFFLIGIVCAIYSKLMRSTIDQLTPSTRNSDPEREPLGQENPSTNGEKLFIAYCCQLFAKMVVEVLFMVLQTQLLYPTKFSSKFDCYLTFETNPPENFHECHNQRADRKSFWMRAVLAVNGIFVAVILIEIIYMFARACKERSFLKNSKFLKSHLNPSHEKLHQGPQKRGGRVEHGSRQSRVRESRPTQFELHREPQRQNDFVQQQPDLGSDGKPVQLQRFIAQTKKIIKEDTHRLVELLSPFLGPPGEQAGAKFLTLDQIYTNFVVIPNRVMYDFPPDRREQLKVYTRSREESRPKSMEDLLDGREKKVLIVGRPGIGKTFGFTKFFRDWALDKVFKGTSDAKIHFDAAFLMKFRRIKSLNDLTLRELLTHAEHSPSDHLDDEVWKYIQQHPERVLIVFEGFDRFKYDTKMAMPSFRSTSIEEKMPLQVLYQWLVTGKLLKDATVVTTTRPRALSSIAHLKFDKIYEILGLSSEQVKEYVFKYAGDDKQVAETLWQHISSNTSVLSLCYVPVNSFLMCSCLWQIMQFHRSTDIDFPSYFTKVYQIAVKAFYLKHAKGFRDKHFGRKDYESDDLPIEVEDQFSILGRVAFEGIKEGQLILGENEAHGVEDSVLLHRLPDRLTVTSDQEEQFCFINLTIQEFFAARHIANTMNATELRNFVSGNMQNGRWQLVFHFLSGLMSNQ